MRKTKFLFLLWFAPAIAMAQVDYSVVQVNEESGINFTRITTDNDYVCMPEVRRTGRNINWLISHFAAIPQIFSSRTSASKGPPFKGQIGKLYLILPIRQMARAFVFLRQTAK